MIRKRMAMALLPLTLISYGALSGVSFAEEPEEPERLIQIQEPKDGEEILLDPYESMPAERPIQGVVRGFSRDEIENFSLRVEVDIKTDKWYPQGITRVHMDGTWRLRKAYFGGAKHVIRALLKDKNGNRIASDTITVTIIQ